MSIKAKPSKHRFHNSSNDVIHDHGLKQFVMEPTRLESGSLPDEQPTSDPQRQIPLYLKEEQEEEQYKLQNYVYTSNEFNMNIHMYK